MSIAASTAGCAMKIFGLMGFTAGEKRRGIPLALGNNSTAPRGANRGGTAREGSYAPAAICSLPHEAIRRFGAGSSVAAFGRWRARGLAAGSAVRFRRDFDPHLRE